MASVYGLSQVADWIRKEGPNENLRVARNTGGNVVCEKEMATVKQGIDLCAVICALQSGGITRETWSAEQNKCYVFDNNKSKTNIHVYVTFKMMNLRG